MPDPDRSTNGGPAARRPDAADAPEGSSLPDATERRISRRRMVGYLLAAPTLVAAARFMDPEPAAAEGLPGPTIPEFFDLSDVLNVVAAPTYGLLAITIDKQGNAHFQLPRSENGQGITTTFTMIIADEMDLPMSKVKVTLMPAEPKLLFNQLTAGSSSVFTLYEPVRRAAAVARTQLQRTAARELGVPGRDLTLKDGVFTASHGGSIDFGALTEKAAVKRMIEFEPKLKKASAQKLIGTEQKRVDALDIVMGRKTFTMDLQPKDASPTMICRPPTLNAAATAIQNKAAVLKMPGVTHVLLVPHSDDVQGGVAVVARTFGQCIEAIRALKVSWTKGPIAGRTEQSIKQDLAKAELPMTPALGKVIEETFTFNFRSGSALETNCAVADVRKDRAEIWAPLKSPQWAQGKIAELLKLNVESVKVNVMDGGGSFGRRLFCDGAFEAAVISRSIGQPVKLMWHRADDARHGRHHPLTTSKVRITTGGGAVLQYDQRHTAVPTDFTQGLGDYLTAAETRLPLQNFAQFSETVFTTTANVPYNFGVVTQLLNEIDAFNTFNTSSVRNVYSPDVATATELMVDRVAKEFGRDPMEFRLAFAKDERMKGVLNAVKKAGNWGRKMVPNTAQGIAMRNEYKGRTACLVEIDCTPPTVNRKIRQAVTGPRVTKIVFAIDVGLPINPLGLKAQVMGGCMDGIAQALTYSHHLKDGNFIEASWDNSAYTRQWNVPPVVEIIVMPQTSEVAGGAGEASVGTTMAAVACAYARATGKMPTEFPINHNSPLHFTPYPASPPVPEVPSDGLERAGIKRKTTKKKRAARKKKRPAAKKPATRTSTSTTSK
ncbi:molybdopterin cofactor-binding domain-containing protein [Patulibacter minatonensis]|uniref:molybdopterin cofactor-binding domain-containing protein n=1 Tax=Patulibacter minatonensis TaxID=298163 RepID=UPI000A048472|nr:molybdopterin cofactor-binding domain-containing protein [Patulibacter minatonensis]